MPEEIFYFGPVCHKKNKLSKSGVGIFLSKGHGENLKSDNQVNEADDNWLVF